MRYHMSVTCRRIVRAVFWVPRVLIQAAFTLLIAAALCMGVVQLPETFARLVRAYRAVNVEDSEPRNWEPLTKSPRRRRGLFNTGSPVRRGEPPL